MFLLPCAFHIILLVFLLSPLSGLEVLQDEGVCLSAPLGQGAQELREKRDGDQRKTFGLLKWCLRFLAHLGRDTGVFQQHSGPHGRVTGHKLPVTADLGSSEQSFGVQVCEDAEEGCTHLQDLWTDHLAGFGRALFMAAGLVVDSIRATWKRESNQTFWHSPEWEMRGGRGGVAPLCFLWHCKYMHLYVYTWNFARLLVDCWTELPYGINKVVPDKLNLSSTGILPHGGAKLHQIVTMSFYLFLLCCHRWCHLSQHSSSNISPHWLIPSLALEAISLEAIRATKQYSHPQSPLLVSRLHHLHSRLPNEPKKPSHVSHAEGEKQSVCRCIPSDETWQKVSIRKNTSEQNNATKVLSGFFFLMRQPSQVRGICHRAQTQFHFSPECMSPPVIEFTKNPKQLNSRWRKMESSVE